MKWLVIDANNLASRAHYAIQGLSYGNNQTGALFGFFRDLCYLNEKFRPDSYVHCFDLGPSLRELDHPSYKIHRRSPINFTVAQRDSRDDLRKQITNLRTTYLPELGFRNVLSQKGYEADDLIASVAMHLADGDEAVVVSNDRDLFQVLSRSVSLWNYKTLMTQESFFSEWRINPSKWARVKAMAGCKSDGVRGISGVGEIFAVRFLRGELPEHHQSYTRIIKGRGVMEHNLELVTLPYPGTKVFSLEEDKLSSKAWLKMCKSLGFDSLKESCPLSIKAVRNP